MPEPPSSPPPHAPEGPPRQGTDTPGIVNPVKKEEAEDDVEWSAPPSEPSVWTLLEPLPPGWSNALETLRGLHPCTDVFNDDLNMDEPLNEDNRGAQEETGAYENGEQPEPELPGPEVKVEQRERGYGSWTSTCIAGGSSTADHTSTEGKQDSMNFCNSEMSMDGCLLGSMVTKPMLTCGPHTGEHKEAHTENIGRRSVLLEPGRKTSTEGGHPYTEAEVNESAPRYLEGVRYHQQRGSTSVNSESAERSLSCGQTPNKPRTCSEEKPLTFHGIPGLHVSIRL